MISVLEQLKAQKITIEQASIILNCSKRTVFRLRNRYSTEGAGGLIHKNKGRASIKAIPQETLAILEELLAGDFKGFGPTFVKRKIAEPPYNIKMSRETIRQFCKKKGFVIQTRKRSPYRSKRPRKCRFGDMWQLDGSYHDWFEGRAAYCSLIAIVDDATSAIIGLQFHNREATRAVMATLKEAFQHIGAPRTLYTDQHSIYRMPNRAARERGEKSELEKACAKLGITVVHANSPQAKGRVERKFRVLQDHLVKELTLRRISTIEEANTYLRTVFIAEHNKAYAVAPLITENGHLPITDFNLDEILTVNTTRILKKDWTLSYKDKLYQLHKDQPIAISPGDTILVRSYLDYSLKFFKESKELKATTVNNFHTGQEQTLFTDLPVLVPNQMTPKPRASFFLPDEPPIGYRLGGTQRRGIK